MRQSSKRKSVEVLNRYLEKNKNHSTKRKQNKKDDNLRTFKLLQLEDNKFQSNENTHASEVQEEFKSRETKNLVVSKHAKESRNGFHQGNNPKINNIKLNNYIRKAQKIIDKKTEMRYSGTVCFTFKLTCF